MNQSTPRTLPHYAPQPQPVERSLIGMVLDALAPNAKRQADKIIMDAIRKKAEQ